MRRCAASLVALLAAMPLTGCGESEPASTTARAATTPAAQRSARLSDCERKGLGGRTVVTPAEAEGTCRTKSGQVVTLVRFGEFVQLRDLSFKVNETRTATHIPDDGGELAAHGRFVIVSVTLENDSDAVQRVDENQFRLEMDARLFVGSRAALRADSDSLVQRTSTGLAPGATVTGNVIFDVPSRLAPELVRSGFFTGFSFTTAVAGHPLPHVRAGVSPMAP